MIKFSSAHPPIDIQTPAPGSMTFPCPQGNRFFFNIFLSLFTDPDLHDPHIYESVAHPDQQPVDKADFFIDIPVSPHIALRCYRCEIRAPGFKFFREHCDGKVPVMKELKAEKEKLLTLQSVQRKELSGFDQMERELQTAAVNVDVILHLDTVPNKQKGRIQAER